MRVSRKSLSFHFTFISAVASLIFLLLSLPHFASADENTHTYNQGERVTVYANKMGPFNNPLETYAFFELPGCPPKSFDHKMTSIGQALVGDELYETQIKVLFNENTEGAICTFRPSVKEVQRWTQMVEEQYWYELMIDDLPMWATFGKMIDGKPHVYTRYNIAVGSSSKSGETNRIVSANLSAEVPVKIAVDQAYEFSFKVSFQKRGDIDFENRFLRFREAGFFEHSIHWFSIVNSFMMVLALAAFVIIILSRTLKSDYARFQKEDLERGKIGGLGLGGGGGSLVAGGLSSIGGGASSLADESAWPDESGWKLLAGDVHRVPLFPEMLCALVGQGWQLTIATLFIIALAFVTSSLHTSKGAIVTYYVFVFSLTSLLGGYVGGSLFQTYCVSLPALATQRNFFMALSAVGFSGFVLAFGFLLNFVAIIYDSAQAIPFWGMLVVFGIWAVIVVPLTTVGGMWGRHRTAASLSGRPVPHVNVIPRLVPNANTKSWYATAEALALFGGLLPFGSIFIELYYIFASFWGYKMYYVFGFLFLVTLMLLLVTACSCIVVMYLLLNGEDHRWHWTAFSSGASVGLYIFFFSGYYFVFKTRMTGLFMTCFYFGYSFLMSVGMALACGAVAFTAARYFIGLIYNRLRKD